MSKITCLNCSELGHMVKDCCLGARNVARMSHCYEESRDLLVRCTALKEHSRVSDSELHSTCYFA